MNNTSRPERYRFTSGLITAMLCMVLVSCTSPPAPNTKAKVYVTREGEKYVLYRNGAPFTVKGAAGFTHLPLLHETGGNTIRTWDTAGLGRILDEAHANQLAVIAGLPMPISTILSFYNDTAQTNAQYAAFKAVVNRYKGHPALLMWCLGNEVDFPYRPKFKHFYKTYNRLLKMIHTDDPDHPVTTAVITPDRRTIYNLRWKVPDLDLLSLNVFSQLPHLNDNLGKVSWVWGGPFLITEWGINGPWESESTAWGAPIENTSTKKAEQYQARYQHMPVNNPRFLGACMFYWGQKQEVTHTWYSAFSENGARSEIVNVMQQLWTGRRPAHTAPAVKYMLLDGKGARDNILLTPGSTHTAEMLMDVPVTDSLRVEWEILHEDWYLKNWYEPNTKKPATAAAVRPAGDAFKVTFNAPAQAGPFRIFATVFDNQGQFATANTPFYVVTP